MKAFWAKFKSPKIFGSALPSASALTLIVWRQYVQHFRAFMRISILTLLAWPFIIPGVLYPVIGIGPTGRVIAGNPANPGLALGLAAAGTAAAIFVGALVRPALIATIYMKLIGRTLKPAAALKRGFEIFWRYVAVLIALSIIVAAGFALLYVPGIVAGIYFLLTEQAVVLEDEKGVAAFKRSAELVHGRFWALLWRVVVSGGLFLLAAFCLEVLATQLPLALLSGLAVTAGAARLLVAPFLLVSALISALTFPLFMTLQVVLFAELRKLRKN